MSTTAFLALGSNLGDRADYLRRGLELLGQNPGLAVVRCSAIYETAPVGGPTGQGAYLNAACEVATTLSAQELLRRCLAIEAELGRVRTVQDGPRTLDLDVLLFGDLVHADETLIVPHPRLHERLFVLEPLNEIAPGAMHPVLQKSIAQLKGQLLGVTPLGAIPGRELAGLRALVTGSTSGIGRAIAWELGRAGASVIVHGRRSPTRAAEVATDVRRMGAERSAVLLADLRNSVERARLSEEALGLWGGLDVLVNNAGADTLTGEAAGWSFERKLEELLAVDLQATMDLSRRIGGAMKAARGGVVLNMGWDQAETGMEGDSGELFAAIKGAIVCFSRSLALSLAPQVRVHCLAPGWIRTAWGETASEVWQERVRRETPLGVWGQPEDVAAMARWLCGPGARYLTGQTLRINGGAVRG